MNIIAFTGPRGVGKTYTAQKAKEILNKNDNIYILSFANFLRDWVENVFGYWLVTQSKSPEKDNSLRLLHFEQRMPDQFREDLQFSIPTNATARDILIFSGDLLRSINKDIFCIAMEKKILEIRKIDSNSIILIDDLRFDNELDWLKNLPYNTCLVYIDRIDKSLESEKVNDYQPKEKCDKIYEVFTESIREMENNTIDRQWISYTNNKELSDLLEDILGENNGN